MRLLEVAWLSPSCSHSWLRLRGWMGVKKGGRDMGKRQASDMAGSGGQKYSVQNR